MPNFSDKLADAARVLEEANPTELANLKAYRAVAGVPLQEQRVAQPSLGGLTSDQMELIGRQAAAAERAHEADVASRARWLDEQEAVIKRLCAGQTESNQRAIRATFQAMKNRS